MIFLRKFLLLCLIPTLAFGTQQLINIGSTPNSGTGDPLRVAMQKTNDNFTELYNVLFDPAFNFKIGFSGNALDTSAHSQTVIGGFVANPNAIGIPFIGVNGGPSGSYSSGISKGHYSSVFGGYDNVNNGYASQIIAQHGRIYDTADHSIIAGGAIHYIQNGPGQSIFGGQLHRINSLTGYNAIVGGSTHTISGGGSNGVLSGASNTISAGTYGALVGGISNTLSSSGNSNAIIGGQSHSVTGTASFAALVGGFSNTVNAQYGTIIGGTGSNVSAYSGSAIACESCAVTANHAVAFGLNRAAYYFGGLHYGARVQSVQGDRGNVIFALSQRTIDATLTSLSGYGGTNNATFPINTAGVGRALCVGKEPSASTNTVAYEASFKLYRVAGNVVVPSQTWTLIGVDDIGIAATPVVNATNTLFRVQVTGKLATTIDWNCDIRLATVTS